MTAIRFRDRDSLISSLKDCLGKTKRCDKIFGGFLLLIWYDQQQHETYLRLRCSFDIELGQMEAFTNDEHTRSFLALSVGKGRIQVVPVCPRCASSFN